LTSGRSRSIAAAQRAVAASDTVASRITAFGRSRSASATTFAEARRRLDNEIGAGKKDRGHGQEARIVGGDEHAHGIEAPDVRLTLCPGR
jgi:hypothetical protein